MYKLASIELKRDRIPNTRCKVCGAETTFHKPVCIDHIFELDYARALQEKLAMYTRVIVGSPIWDELLVAEGTLLQLANNFQMKSKVVAAYLRALKRKPEFRYNFKRHSKYLYYKRGC